MNRLDLGNGFVTVRNRTLPINWNGQYAQHLAERHEQDPAIHPFLHVRAQQSLAKAEIHRTDDGWLAIYETDTGTVSIPFLLQRKFVVPKTCMKMNTTAERVKKNKGLSGQAEPAIHIPQAVLEELVELGSYRTLERAREGLTKAILETRRRKRMKKRAKVM